MYQIILISTIYQKGYLMNEFNQRLVLLGKRVKEIRVQKCMTIKELSEKSGISTKYITKIENGQAIGITTKHLDRLCKGLNLSSINEILYFYT